MIEYKSDHAQTIILLLPSQHRDKAKIRTVVEALGDEIQDIEDVAFDVLTKTSIDSAEGAQLDIIGRVLNRPREGVTDATYRLKLRARAVSLMATGEVESVIDVVRFAVSPLVPLIHVEQTYPASILVWLYDEIIPDETGDEVFSSLLFSTAAGVGIQLSFASQLDDQMFFLGQTVYVTSAVTAGDSFIVVNSTDGFADTGTIVVEDGTSIRESLAYVSKTATQFNISGTAGNNHSVGAACQDPNGPGLGLANLAYTTGGFLSSLRA